MEPSIFSNIIKKIIESIGISECGKTNQRVYGHQIWTFVARSRRRGIWPRDNSRVPQPALHVFRRQHGSLRLEVLLIQLFYKTINICHLYLCEFVLYLHFIISWTKMFVLHFTRAQIPLDLQLYRELEFRQIEKLCIVTQHCHY